MGTPPDEEKGIVMGAILTKGICETAMRMLVPSIEEANRMGISNKIAGTFVVLDPETGQVLFEGDLDPDHEKADLYRKIARAKAQLSWETGLPSREVQQSEPWALRIGNTRWGGSTVRGLGKKKLIVAFSGVQALFDEMFSCWMADAVISICRAVMARFMKVDQETSFLANELVPTFD